jgi:hypothetical protein
MNAKIQAKDYEALCEQATDEQMAQHLGRTLGNWRAHMHGDGWYSFCAASQILQGGRGTGDEDADAARARIQAILESGKCSELQEAILAAASCALNWPEARKVSWVVWPVVENLQQAVKIWIDEQSADLSKGPLDFEHGDWVATMHNAIDIKVLMAMDLRTFL